MTSTPWSPSPPPEGPRAEYPTVVLGGGLAGLAFAFYAASSGLAHRVFERKAHTGGTCVTFRRGGFLFDSGAHRIHDKDPQTTRDIFSLMGDDLLRVEVPSSIYDDGHFITFPFGVRDLLKHVGVRHVAAGAVELIGSRISRRPVRSFADAAIRRYGATIARRFLLNYTEKLWGLPCDELMPDVSGGRLEGLDLREVFRDTLRTVRSARHMEGRFFYPRLGIGMLTEALAAHGADITAGMPVTRVFHDGSRVTGVGVGEETIRAAHVVSTLPLDRLVEILDSPLDDDIRAASRHLRYRHVILTAFFLNIPRITNAATVYFPDESFPFTRVVEPRNRSPLMSPPQQTSLVAEIPCWDDDDLWTASDDRLIALVRTHLERIGWLRPDHIVGTAVERLDRAYPVGTLQARDAVASIIARLSRIQGLHLLGRNGTFRYAWIHDLMRDARILAERIAACEVATARG